MDAQEKLRPVAPGEYKLIDFGPFLQKRGLGAGTIAVYVSVVKTTLRAVKSTRPEDVLSYFATKPSASATTAWNLFVDYAREKRFDVAPLPAGRTRATLQKRTHPYAQPLLCLVNLALDCRYKFEDPLVLGDFFLYNNVEHCLRDIRRRDYGDGTSLTPRQDKALRTTLAWAWALPDAKDITKEDTRPLFPQESFNPRSPSITAHQIAELAQTYGDLRVAKRMQIVARGEAVAKEVSLHDTK